MRHDPPTLVIIDGSLAGLVGAMMQAERGPVIAWTPPAGSALAEETWDRDAGAERARAQAEALGLEGVVEGAPIIPGGGAADAVPWGVRALAELASAAVAAGEAGAARLVWPAARGSDVDAMFAAGEVAALVGRAGWLRGPGGPGEGAPALAGGEAVEIQTPYLDLTTDQLRELLEDLGGSEDLCLAAGAEPGAAA